MSLTKLPTELVVMVFEGLVNRDDPDCGWYEDYMNLASTCKRFLCIAEANYKRITKLDPWFDKYSPHSIQICNSKEGLDEEPSTASSITMTKFSDRLRERVCPVAKFKYINYTKVIVIHFKFIGTNRLEISSNSAFDRVTELRFVNCKLDSRTFSMLLSQLKNVDCLELFSNEYGKSQGAVPLLERTLKCIKIINDLSLPLLEPNIKLPAKVVYFNPNKLEAANSAYIRRFKPKIELLVVLGTTITWYALSQQHGLADIRWTRGSVKTRDQILEFSMGGEYERRFREWKKAKRMADASSSEQ